MLGLYEVISNGTVKRNCNSSASAMWNSSMLANSLEKMAFGFANVRGITATTRVFVDNEWANIKGNTIFKFKVVGELVCGFENYLKVNLRKMYSKKLV